MKIAIPWIVAALLASLCYWLYDSRRGPQMEIANLKLELQELESLRAEVAQLRKLSSESNELARLRKDNEDLIRLRGEITRMREASRQLSNQLQTAEAQRGQAVQQQQQLSQMAAENQQLRAQTQQVQQLQAQAQANACINNLRQIDAAKQQWALDNQRPAYSLPTFADLAKFFPNGTPACPAGGTYGINALSVAPTCNVPGHVIPRQQ